MYIQRLALVFINHLVIKYIYVTQDCDSCEPYLIIYNYLSYKQLGLHINYYMQGKKFK